MTFKIWMCVIHSIMHLKSNEICMSATLSEFNNRKLALEQSNYESNFIYV